MKLSTKTRYGMRLMLELGLHFERGSVFLKDIAYAEEISEKYLSQIIIPLKAAGLVNSFRGARGGYSLSKSPEQITIKDIVGALEEHFYLVDCIKNTADCTRVSQCVTRNLWDDLGKTIQQKLTSITLMDLVDQYKGLQKNAVANTI